MFKVTRDRTGNLPPMPGVFPDYPAPVVRNTGTERELTMMRWGMPPPPKFGGSPVTGKGPMLKRRNRARSVLRSRAVFRPKLVAELVDWRGPTATLFFDFGSRLGKSKQAVLHQTSGLLLVR